jgi:hypothetical protein
MTPFQARLSLLAVLAIFLATAANALFLQGAGRLRRFNDGSPSTAVSITQFPVDKPSGVEPVSLTGVSRPSAPSAKGQGVSGGTKLAENDPKLYNALERELARKGYPSLSRPSASSLRSAVLDYEFDSGLPLTGKPTEALLKRLIFDLDPAPRGFFADRVEADPKLVLQTQKSLLELGFFSGTLSGRVDIWTANAVKAFERYRGLPETGRLTEVTLLELISYAGQPLRSTSE